MEEKPLPLATHNLLPTSLTLVGYHPAGINPFDLLRPGAVTSKTATQLLSALAAYKVFPSWLNANPLVVDPLGALGYKAALSVSTTFNCLVSIMDTELSLALHTNKYFPSLERTISLGLSPTGMN